MIDAGLSRLEPHRGIATRKHVLLDAECGHIKTVDHVLRGHDELDILPGRDVQFVDLVLPLDMLDFPHPLFRNDINFSRIGGRCTLLKKYDRSPNKERQHHEEWQY